MDKFIVMEQARLETEAESLARQLRAFEQRYQLSSAEFHRRFRAGELGDDADMFEWSAFYQMWLSVQERLEALRPYDCHEGPSLSRRNQAEIGYQSNRQMRYLRLRQIQARKDTLGWIQR